jgi:phosphoribosylformylglycinamidine cyclo-ligase
VGVVERGRILDGSRVMPGDRVIGLASSGLHSNGYSLARKVLLEKLALPLGEVADDLLRPTRIYVKAVLAALKAGELHGAAHITGGGLVENPPRILRDGLMMRLDEKRWPQPAIFQKIAQVVERAEMRRTFNAGIGMVLVAPAGDVPAIRAACEAAGETSFEIGEIVAADGPARVEFV